MAHQGLVNVLGEALFQFFESWSPEVCDKAIEFARWVEQVGAPPEGLELVAKDGARYSGLAVVVNGQVQLFFGAARLGVVPKPQSHAHTTERLHDGMSVDSLEYYRQRGFFQRDEDRDE